jgi:hypothetical protein
MASNYPPGTWEGDPRAPWNAPDPIPCPDRACGGETYPGDECPECGEPTLTLEEAREEAELAAADAAYDRARDEEYDEPDEPYPGAWV